MKKLLIAAALLAALAPLAEAKPVKATAKARVSVRPNRVKVQATTRQVMPTARNGQYRWSEWDRLSSPQNVTTTPAQRPR
jgi:hypothetical protein